MIEPYVERARLLIDAVLAVFRRDPGISPTITLLTVAVVLLIAAAVAVALMIALTPSKRKVLVRRQVITGDESAGGLGEAVIPEQGDDASELARSDDTAPSVRRLPSAFTGVLTGWPFIIALSGIVLSATYVASGTTSYCTSSCHLGVVHGWEAEPFESAVSGASTETVAPAREHHAQCVSCHSSGFVANVFDRARMLVVAVSGGSDEGAGAIVDSARCMRCHAAVLRETLTASTGILRVSHVEPHEAGMACTVCHQRIGHADAIDPSMSQCIECHDAVLASAECATCHTTNPTDGAVALKGREGSAGRVYSLVSLDSGNCYGCHVPDACDSCHGVRLPHSAEYAVGGGHAYDAAWEGKFRLCYACHAPGMCNQCHRSFGERSGHPASFKQEHRLLRPDSTCSCHDNLRPQRTESFCTVCHEGL